MSDHHKPIASLLRIRRHVIGQVLAYASSLWQMPFEQFEAAFEARADRSLQSLADDFDDAQWSVDAFRRSLAANLQSGAFRVVVAVDDITDELKRTITYLNRHTTIELEVVALEIGYMRDGDVEMLIPTVYGEETVITKRQSRAPKWNEDTFWEHAASESSPHVLHAIRQLYDWAVTNNASFYWGEGKIHPSMTAWIPLAQTEAPVWTCYLGDGDSTVLGLNFGWLNTRMTETQLKGLAQDLRSIPEAVDLLTGVEDSGYRKRPSLRVEGVLTQPEAMESLLASYDRFIANDTK